MKLSTLDTSRAKLIAAAFALIAAAQPLAAFNISDYRFHAMPETSYYGGIHSITKDGIGRIWFSGYDALYMYNGNSFTQMNDLVTRISPSAYWAYGQVITDSSKRLYVGTNHGLLRFNYERQDFERILEGNIGSVTAHGDGSVWIIRNNGIESFLPDGLPVVVRYPFPSGTEVSSLSLMCARDHIYAALGGKVYRLDRGTGQYDLFAALGDDDYVIRDVMEYDESVYILTHMDGLYECGADGGILRHYNLPVEYEKSASSKQLYLDSSCTIWVATQSGLLLLDPLTRKTHLLRSNLYYSNSLPNNSVWSIFPDPDGGVWVGTYGGKLAYMTFQDNDVNFFKATPGGLNHPIVSCFEEDAEGNLWIGTEGGGLNYWDRKNDRFLYYTQENGTGITSNMIKKLWYDKNNILLISAFNGGMEQFDGKRKRFVDLRMYHPRSSQRPSVYEFAMEGGEGVWMTDPDSELMYKDNRTGIVEIVPVLNSGGETVRMQIETLFRDKGDNLWLITHNGAYVVDVSTRRIVRHYFIEDAPYSVNNLCSFCITSDSDIWFGTRGGGVNRLSNDGTYVNFEESGGEGLSGKTVFGILEDTASKNIWFSTNDGLYYYDYKNSRINKSHIDNPNLCGAYYVRACYKTSKGEMLFGGTDGFIMFTPGKIKYNNQKPRVFFTELLINNKTITPEGKNSPIKQSISTLSRSEDNKITLSHRQSNIEICFSADSYLHASKNQYAYRMAGLSDEWYILPQEHKSVQFFNLPAGNYTFEVKAANSDGLWGDEIASLRFEVRPSPFFSVWAYIVYALMLLAVIYFIWRYTTNKKIFEHRLEMEQIKEQNMKELTQARINFFTNISHDLKTPLTLVIDPLKQLKEHLRDDRSVDPYMQLIEKNVNRIQRTISQLLQFREIESQKITLNQQPGDLIEYIGSIFSLFDLYANKKGIETDFSSQLENFHTRFDHDVIEKIFTNLFSNAFKYTSENGYVGVRIGRAEPEEAAGLAAPADSGFISVTVTNTGAAIPEDKKEAIFESFNHLGTQRPAFEESSGLGLAIVRELVENLGGKITLHSDRSMVSFSLVLPFATNAAKAGDDTESSVVSYDYTISEIDNILAESGGADPNEKRNRKACDIVVIEDDPDLRNYLERRLSKRYNVYTAANGSEGIAKVERVNPKIVITDLMMPEADGFAVCRSLHSNIKTSHIPIIMLSAMGKNSENKIKALECGANVFIDKPFDVDYLAKQVDNLIKAQNELKELYSKKYIAEPSKITISSMDEELLKKAMEHIERNITNADYNVESFVADMAIGRTILYQKINDITGMSIKEFILDIRLKRSAQLLKESDLTISEIADLTGFSNQKYFSICFKKHFELTPSEFKKKP